MEPTTFSDPENSQLGGQTPLTISVFPPLSQEVSDLFVFLYLFQRASVPSVFLFVFLQVSALLVSLPPLFQAS